MCGKKRGVRIVDILARTQEHKHGNICIFCVFITQDDIVSDNDSKRKTLFNKKNAEQGPSEVLMSISRTLELFRLIWKTGYRFFKVFCDRDYWFVHLYVHVVNFY